MTDQKKEEIVWGVGLIVVSLIATTGEWNGSDWLSLTVQIVFPFVAAYGMAILWNAFHDGGEEQ